MRNAAVEDDRVALLLEVDPVVVLDEDIFAGVCLLAFSSAYTCLDVFGQIKVSSTYDSCTAMDVGTDSGMVVPLYPLGVKVTISDSQCFSSLCRVSNPTIGSVRHDRSYQQQPRNH